MGDETRKQNKISPKDGIETPTVAGNLILDAAAAKKNWAFCTHHDPV